MSKAKEEAGPQYLVEANLHNQSGGGGNVQIKTTFAFLQQERANLDLFRVPTCLSGGFSAHRPEKDHPRQVKRRGGTRVGYGEEDPAGVTRTQQNAAAGKMLSISPTSRGFKSYHSGS